ncbi:hypothetical protein [Burkholderia seminalis]|uniref:glycine-rich domain-containing protein n=1 Tax=Burkholderia seminalis TaxID=488731 RepID=UPI00158C9AE9|nr:hypothetical protein [Burkholderia seminalis]
MAVYLSPVGNSGTPFLTLQGLLLAGGQIFTYQAGSTTPQATFTDPTQTVQNPNPIILNTAGLPPQQIWLLAGQRYKFIIEDAQGNTLQVIDNVSGINDITVFPNEWVSSGLTPTYVNATQFTVPGNQQAIFHFGRRIQANISAGTVFGSISAVSFSTVTTVTVNWDSGQLDSGLNTVSYALMSSRNPSVPNALVNIQVFPTAGTYSYTPEPGATCMEVVVVGAGGGSAGVPSTGPSQASAAGGGGGGATARSFFSGAQGLAGTSIVVGSGGAGGAAGLNNGSNGGQSSFGSLTAAGGGGAPATPAGIAPLIAGGGAAGVAAGGNLIRLQGAPGGQGLVTTAGSGVGGGGGANGLGWPGVVGNTSGNPGIAGANAGTGGAGGCQTSNGGALAGAAGKDGVVMIYEYV